jgi:hypothetical protein
MRITKWLLQRRIEKLEVEQAEGRARVAIEKETERLTNTYFPNSRARNGAFLAGVECRLAQARAKLKEKAE